MATLDLGKVKFTWKGIYSAQVTYEVDDVVSYEGSSFIVVSGNASGTTPSVGTCSDVQYNTEAECVNNNETWTANADWDAMALKGDLGSWTHPSYPAIAENLAIGDGYTGGQILGSINLSAAVDNLGHVTNLDFAGTSRTLELNDLGYTGDIDADKYTAWEVGVGGIETPVYTDKKVIFNSPSDQIDITMNTTGDNINIDFSLDPSQQGFDPDASYQGEGSLKLSMSPSSGNIDDYSVFSNEITTGMTSQMPQAMDYHGGLISIDQSNPDFDDVPGIPFPFETAPHISVSLAVGSNSYQWKRVALAEELQASAYQHPTYPGDDVAELHHFQGAEVPDHLTFNILTDEFGHVSHAEGLITSRTLTLDDLGYTGDTDANNYESPTTPTEVINTNIQFSQDLGDTTGPQIITNLTQILNWDNSLPTESSATIQTEQLKFLHLKGDQIILEDDGINDNPIILAQDGMRFAMGVNGWQAAGTFSGVDQIRFGPSINDVVFHENKITYMYDDALQTLEKEPEGSYGNTISQVLANKTDLSLGMAHVIETTRGGNPGQLYLNTKGGKITTGEKHDHITGILNSFNSGPKFGQSGNHHDHMFFCENGWSYEQGVTVEEDGQFVCHKPRIMLQVGSVNQGNPSAWNDSQRGFVDPAWTWNVEVPGTANITSLDDFSEWESVKTIPGSYNVSSYETGFRVLRLGIEWRTVAQFGLAYGLTWINGDHTTEQQFESLPGNMGSGDYNASMTEAALRGWSDDELLAIFTEEAGYQAYAIATNWAVESLGFKLIQDGGNARLDHGFYGDQDQEEPYSGDGGGGSING